MIEEIIPGNCSKLMTDTKPKVSESTKKDKNRVKLLKIKENQKSLKAGRGEQKQLRRCVPRIKEDCN